MQINYLILSYLILSYLILSYLILSYLILSCLITCLITYLITCLITCLITYLFTHLFTYLILSYLVLFYVYRAEHALLMGDVHLLCYCQLKHFHNIKSISSVSLLKLAPIHCSILISGVARELHVLLLNIR